MNDIEEASKLLTPVLESITWRSEVHAAEAHFRALARLYLYN
jgi:hypothetical protein